MPSHWGLARATRARPSTPEHGPLCLAGSGHTMLSNTSWEDRVCGPMESKGDHHAAGLLPGGIDRGRKRRLPGWSSEYGLTHGHALHLVGEWAPAANFLWVNVYIDECALPFFPDWALSHPVLLLHDGFDFDGGGHGLRGGGFNEKLLLCEFFTPTMLKSRVCKWQSPPNPAWVILEVPVTFP